MTLHIVHISDLHFNDKWAEDRVVLDAFFQDLRKQLAEFETSRIYAAFSGDVLRAGSNLPFYSSLQEYLDKEFLALNIPKEHRICVPGNHDISADYVRDNIVDHEGVVSQNLSEQQFNEYISRPANMLVGKFANYKVFESQFAGIGISHDTLSGAGWDIDGNFGIYCLNSALCSSAGIKASDGASLLDRERLAIDTQTLHKWNLSCKAKAKILVMHHPLSWLTDWSQRELKAILRSNFSLCLSGHAHDQDILCSANLPLIECSAPPLLTNKYGQLGYSIITMASDGEVSEIVYRQWTKHNTFVAGTNFSNTDDGKITFKEQTKDSTAVADNKASSDLVDFVLNAEFESALRSFSSQPHVWVEPTLKTISETSQHAADNSSPVDVSISEIITKPTSTIIRAEPQYGLTCLARFLAREAWRVRKSLWLYFDTRGRKPHAIQESIVNEVRRYGCEMESLDCIILDSWTSNDKPSCKILQRLSTLFPHTPLIVMQTTYLGTLDEDSPEVEIDREFAILYLWALSRGQVRKIVNDYNQSVDVGDEDAVVAKAVADLEVLNLPRTPLNCLTLLKVWEIEFDDSPLNRTEMIKRVLFLLFNMENLPTYHDKPDLKDCEYALGRFCEILLRKDIYYFTRENFLGELRKFCAERVIDLEVQVVFDILYANNILVQVGHFFCFRFAYWIYYFAAHRMHHDSGFAQFILQDMRYISYPEIIEFYTGIDRLRDDALSVLVRDMQSTCDLVHTKCGIPDGMNPYKFAQWKPSPTMIERMQSEVTDSVQHSKLPDSVKDQYADRWYDRARPYDQKIRSILTQYSLPCLMQQVVAGSRALRNSDYVSPDVKRQLLQQIMRSWEQIAKVILFVAPVLAQDGYATFDGLAMLLSGDFGDTVETRFFRVLRVIPSNVLKWYKDDLYSRKMGPLLIEQYRREEDIRRHLLALLLVYQRPHNWRVQIEEYISTSSRNSFYLYDIYMALREEYRYGYVSENTLRDLKHLIKMAAAKHETGTKKPGAKLIRQVSDGVLPSRDV